MRTGTPSLRWLGERFAFVVIPATDGLITTFWVSVIPATDGLITTFWVSVIPVTDGLKTILEFGHKSHMSGFGWRRSLFSDNF